MGEPDRGKVALITGASGKMGRALSHELRAEGAKVLGVARHLGDWKRVMREQGSQASFVAYEVDLSDPNQVTGLVEDALAVHGTVDILVHLAATRIASPLVEQDLAGFKAELQTVLVSGFQLMQGLVPRMADDGWGRVISFGGTSAQTGAAGRVAVTAAKAGLMGLSRSVAREVATRGVTVNVVSPGSIAEAGAAQSGRDIPVGRPGEVQEVVALCSYLWSDDAGYVTGQTFNINGGRLMS
jgi:3-oxoacyl-[acyl-carrier protein] reductase